jgi:hypothetical protein
MDLLINSCLVCMSEQKKTLLTLKVEAVSSSSKAMMDKLMPELVEMVLSHVLRYHQPCSMSLSLHHLEAPWSPCTPT